MFVLWSSLCIIVPADVLRLRWPAFEKLYERVLGFLMRDSEKVRVICPLLSPPSLAFHSPVFSWFVQHSTNGVIWYILGVNFALQFYPQDVATIAILMYVSLPPHLFLTLLRFT